MYVHLSSDLCVTLFGCLFANLAAWNDSAVRHTAPVDRSTRDTVYSSLVSVTVRVRHRFLPQRMNQSSKLNRNILDGTFTKNDSRRTEEKRERE